MGLHLVTGFKGTAHITSADQGVFNAGCVGTGEYVFAVGRKFEAQVIASNTIRVFDGSLSMQGRHVNLENGTFLDVTISDGLQSMNRNDLIVLRYTKDVVNSVESVELVVIQGTQSESTAVDPLYTTGNILSGATLHEMPLYRVKMSGLNVTTVEPMFNVLAPMSDLHHSFYTQNMIINGDFQCNQRGEKTYKTDTSSAYTLDMWRGYQVQVKKLNEGIELTGMSATTQGYFTQFIQLGKLKTTNYVISAMADGKICTFSVTPGATAKEKNFGKFKISALTTSVWDNNLNDYSNKLKINICPIGTNTITLTYVNVFEGFVAHPHIKEDVATALVRCKMYIQSGTCMAPIFYSYKEDTNYSYEFAISCGGMVSTPTVAKGTYTYPTAVGVSMNELTKATDVVGTNNYLQFRTVNGIGIHTDCHTIKVEYVLTCEPTDK